MMGVKWDTQTKAATDYDRFKREVSDMTVTVLFPDGAMYEAPSFVAMEDTLMADVWNPSDPKKFRQEMARRADVWSGWYLNPESRSEAFLRGMEKAGMLRLEVRK